MDEPEKLPAELRLELLEAEQQIEKNMPEPFFKWQRGIATAVLTGFAFAGFGFFSRAPLGSTIAFAFIGAAVGFCVGSCKRPPRKQQ